jgi:hypothetical protein
MSQKFCTMPDGSGRHPSGNAVSSLLSRRWAAPGCALGSVARGGKSKRPYSVNGMRSKIARGKHRGRDAYFHLFPLTVVARERAETLRPVPVELAGISARATAAELNARAIETPTVAPVGEDRDSSTGATRPSSLKVRSNSPLALQRTAVVRLFVPAHTHAPGGSRPGPASHGIASHHERNRPMVAVPCGDGSYPNG